MALLNPEDFNLDLIKQIAPCTFEIPIGFVPNMKVHALFFATPEMAELSFFEFREWLKNPSTGLPSILQLAYTATLPGISEASFGMPDMHSGYGFSIGGVAAFDVSNPLARISPGGVGYDINCGIRCLTTHLSFDDVRGNITQLIEAMVKLVPTGVGGKRGSFINQKDIIEICRNGAEWAVNHGYGVADDLVFCEENGKMSNADPSLISQRAISRGIGQLGTLGAGNHYIEIQMIDEIFHPEAAKIMGLELGEIVVTIHTGSRGLGYQVAQDFINEMESLPQDEVLPDNQLSSALISSEIGQKYLKAMAGAANYAWANRQIITHFVRKAFQEVLGSNSIKMDLIYDVAHNIAKIESHNGHEYVVHRKGATRSFGSGREELPLKYRGIGQPVLIGGSMGTASYILLGDVKNNCFGSTCHGAGRTMSRSKASREISPEEIQKLLNENGIEMKAASKKTIIEEAPETYKDIEAVVDACQQVGLSQKVCRLKPLGVIKG